MKKRCFDDINIFKNKKRDYQQGKTIISCLDDINIFISWIKFWVESRVEGKLCRNFVNIWMISCFNKKNKEVSYKMDIYIYMQCKICIMCDKWGNLV